MSLFRLLLLALLVLSPAFSWAEGQEKARNIDPWESVNRKIYVFNDTLDQEILRPVAKGYKYVMPDLAEQGVTNFIMNIYEFNSFFNSLLQGEFIGASQAAGRFLVNSTLGLLGFVDVATPMGIKPFRADFGQTLAVWGVDSGPYVMLPVFGPHTVRSSIGYFGDTYTSIPYLINEQTWAWGFWTVELIDYRARLLDAEDLITGDRYIFLRDAYLQRRESFVKRGKVDDSFSDFEQDSDDWEDF
jgi:phospholipid-binding lipoprotein MlaA